MGNILIVIGIVIIVIGLLVTYSIHIPFLGKLPGDINIQGEHVHFYFPIVTCIIVSIILSLIFYLFSR